MPILFTVPGMPISVNHLYVNLGPGRRFPSAEGKSFKHAVSWLATIAMKQAGYGMIISGVGVWLKFYFKTMGSDIDNCIKAILDAMTGIAYKNDTQILKLYAEKFKEPANPRTEVTIYEEDQCPTLKMGP